MKLSKRVAAAIIAICMLLISSLPTFAATVNLPNNSMILPEGGATVSLNSTGLGHANDSIGIVLDTASAEALGIDAAKLKSTSIKTEGTNYDGIILSGKMKLANLVYNSEVTSGHPSIIKDVLKNGDLVEFEFANVEVSRIRTNNAGTNVVLEIAYQEYMDGVVPGTAKRLAAGKITGEETEPVIFSDDDLYTLTEDECKSLKGTGYRTNGAADFYGTSSDAFRATEILAKAGADYKFNTTINTYNFPEGTIFVSSANLNANGASMKSTTEWMATSSGYSEGYNSFSKTSAPYGDYLAQTDGNYYVYALKTYYNTDSSRNAKVTVNEVDFTFQCDHVPTSLNKQVKGWYWEKDETQTITFSEGGLISVKVNCEGYDYSRIAGVAFVPVDKVAAMEAIENWNDFRDGNRFTQAEFSMLHEATTVEYVPAAPVTVKTTVNGTEYEVSSVAAETLVSVGSTDFDGAIISSITVMDALVASGVVNESNKDTFQKTINVKLNGVTITGYDRWIVSEADEITATFPEEINVTNFSPVKVLDVLNTLGGASPGLKICLYPTKTVNTSIAFCHDGTGFVTDAMKGAYFSGIATVNQNLNTTVDGEPAIIPKGEKIYFDSNGGFSGVVVTSGTHGIQYLGAKFFSDNVTVTIIKPDGSVGHHPYFIRQSYYDWTKVYITNSSTTHEVSARFIPATGKWQLYTDGYRTAYVVKYTVDENGKLDKIVSTDVVDVIVGNPCSFKLAEGEKAFVWGYAPFDGTAGSGGTTMVPLTGVIANPAN